MSNSNPELDSKNQILSESTKLSPFQWANGIEKIFDRKAEEIFVIMNTSETTVVFDPGLRRPFATRIRKQAETVRKETGGKITTLAYAIQTLTRKNIDLSKSQ